MQSWATAQQPLRAAPGAARLSTFADVVVDPANGSLHQFAHVDGVEPGIHHASSKDGEAWRWDRHPVLRPGREQWEGWSVGVPTVWLEGATWHMLYRGEGPGPLRTAIGHATARAPGGPWTRVRVNPSWIIASPERPEPAGLIKVDGTYYLFTSTLTQPRCIDLWTSADLWTWTQDPNSPIWSDGRFCNEVWSHGGLYFSLVPHYRDDAAAPADLELWWSTMPQFYVKHHAGIAMRAGEPGAWDEQCLDTPSVLTLDVGKNTYPPLADGQVWIHYAGEDPAGVWRTGLVKVDQAEFGETA